VAEFLAALTQQARSEAWSGALPHVGAESAAIDQVVMSRNAMLRKNMANA
jgi:hypothetical protein